MPDTKTPVEIPAQFIRDGDPSHWETAWEEALDAVEPFLTPQLVNELNSAANGKAIGAYDFGVEWGLGHLPEIEGEAPGYVKLKGIEAAMARIAVIMAELREEIR
jgi:hypothetical protein